MTARPERTAQRHRRFRCRRCGKRFDERSGAALNRMWYPSDVIAPVLLWRPRCEPSPRDPPEVFAPCGIAFCQKAVRDREAKLTPALAEDPPRRRRGEAGRG